MLYCSAINDQLKRKFYQTHITQKLYLAMVLWKYTLPLLILSLRRKFEILLLFGARDLWENSLEMQRFMSSFKNLSVRSLPVSSQCLQYTGGPLWVIHLLITLIEVPQSFHNNHNSITQTILRHFISTNEASGPPTTPNITLSRTQQSHTSMFRHPARSDNEVLNRFRCSEGREEQT